MDTRLNIVVVEDHDALREITVKSLRGMGHDVRGADSAEALVDEIGVRPIDLLVLDLNLPGENGISLARRFRAAQPHVGIIMLTARNQITDKLAGYDSGADIYLTKPTSVEELGAAVLALARRIKHPKPDMADLLLDQAALTLRGAQQVVGLSALEAGLLAAFTRAPEQRLDHWQLMAMSEDLKKNTLEAQITRLRKKLVQAGAGEHPVKAIRSQGYQLCVRLVAI
ncbi:transcriptional regulator [Rhodoferax sp. TS-BS-61-7]|nr:transcriptional regulator [Rhodoferax sp. TS-BS-61-7]